VATQQTDFQKFGANWKTTVQAVTADHSTALDTNWLDMRDYETCAFILTPIALTGVGVTTVTVVGNSESDGTGTDGELIASAAVSAAPDALGDYLFYEISAEQMADASTSTTGRLRYVTIKITADNAADDTAVIAIRKSKRPVSGLTVDTVA
jgi:hypothetical protein